MNTKPAQTRSRTLSVVIASALAPAAFVAIALASPPSGVTPTVLARATYDTFRIASDTKGQVNFEAKAAAPIDIVVRQHDYVPGSTTGWHAHPGPILITVTKGQLTFYEYDDPTCAPHVISAGQGYVDTGHGHIGRNETEQPAQDKRDYRAGRRRVSHRAVCSRPALQILI